MLKIALNFIKSYLGFAKDKNLKFLAHLIIKFYRQLSPRCPKLKLLELVVFRFVSLFTIYSLNQLNQI